MFRLSFLLCATFCATLNALPTRCATSEAPSVAEWASDLDRLVREIHYRHPNPEHFGPRWEDFVAEAKRLKSTLPSLPSWRIPWELSRLVATLSDGHTWVVAESFEDPADHLPIRFESFEDELFIVEATEAYSEFVDARVRRIGQLSTEEVLERAAHLQLTSADNQVSLAWWTCRHLRMRSALAMLGAIDKPGAIEFEVESAEGHRSVLSFGARNAPSPIKALLRRGSPTDGSTASASQDSALYRTEVFPERSTLYWRYNGFREDPQRPWEAFCRAAFDQFERENLSRLILDLRMNGGGDPDFGLPLLRGILRQPELNKPGSLIVLIGARTDSAAVSFCAQLESFAQPLFVGTPTFLRPNGHANAFELKLPATGLGVRISTLYWRASLPSDRRSWIAPDVSVPLRFEDILAGRDVALELALYANASSTPSPFNPTLRHGHAGQDLEAALQKWRATPRNRWGDVEANINTQGYQLMQAGRLQDAIEVFDLNRRLHPQAANVYDSYAEALLAHGDATQALTMYRESIRRDHRNITAIERVLQLEDDQTGELLDLGKLEPTRRFDFLMGDWSYSFEHGSGETHYETVLDGTALREQLSDGIFGEQRFAGASLFRFNAEHARWSQQWIDTLGNALLSTGGMQSYADSDHPTMQLEFDHNGTRMRHVWYDIRANRFETDLLVQRNGEWKLIRRMPYIRRTAH